MSNQYLSIQDVMNITGKKRSWSSNRIRELNEELEKQGFFINRGRIPAKYFYKRMGLEYEEN